ncbi:histidine triad nucleotide-binding protein 2, mitochondrial [Manduca sexta]|uniref:histidine triad nucleotide-binding protein 2, mitochondrial n=1 Tax=Manduca sexta TaxID=7130 RepID=UPI001890896B|nr:histidine triad nucleotide-binding protein 2, mitochondrial [Manduca sexta]
MAVEVSNKNNSLFYKRKIPETCLYEDENCVAFDEDIEDMQTPIHFLVVPKKVIPRLSETTVDDEKLLGHLLLVAKQIAIQKGLHKHGYHVVVDENYRASTLNSLHVFGRALHHMLWPIGPGARL